MYTDGVDPPSPLAAVAATALVSMASASADKAAAGIRGTTDAGAASPRLTGHKRPRDGTAAPGQPDHCSAVETAATDDDSCGTGINTAPKRRRLVLRLRPPPGTPMADGADHGGSRGGAASVSDGFASDCEGAGRGGAVGVTAAATAAPATAAVPPGRRPRQVSYAPYAACIEVDAEAPVTITAAAAPLPMPAPGSSMMQPAAGTPSPLPPPPHVPAALVKVHDGPCAIASASLQLVGDMLAGPRGAPAHWSS